MGIIAAMEASSGAPRERVNDACRLVWDAARTIPPRPRAGVVRSDGGRHFRLPGAFRSACPNVRFSRRAGSRRDGPSTLRPPRKCWPIRAGCRFPRIRSISSCCRTRSNSRASRISCCARCIARCGRKARSDRRLQSVLAVRRPTLFRARRVAAVERQLHRALPPEGLARASRLRGHRRRSRLLRAAVHAGKMAVALELLRGCRRSLVADRRRRLLPARNQAGARDARDHAGVGAAQEWPRDGAAAGARVHRARPSERRTH